MVTHVQTTKDPASGKQAGSGQFSKMLVLSEPCQTDYKRGAGQTVVHQMIERLASFSSMSRFLARIFENFNSVGTISLYMAKNGHLEHSLTLAKRNGRIYIRCHKEKIENEDDNRLKAHRESNIIIYDGPTATKYRFNLDPNDIDFTKELTICTDFVQAVFPLHSGRGSAKQGVMVIEGKDIRLINGEQVGAAAIQESADALVSIARMVSYIIDNGYDYLTGLPRERQFAITLGGFIEEFYRTGQNCAVIRFDIDHLKEINDMDGHDAGNAAIQSFSEVVSNSVRTESRNELPPDIVFRLGGGADEFIALLPGVDVSTARVIADRVRRRVQEQTIVTCSCGVSDLATLIGDKRLDTDKATSTILKETDGAVYQAKQDGRNRIYSIRTSDDGALVTELFAQ